MAAHLLMLSKMVDRRLWSFENPLRQFPTLSQEVHRKLENRRMTIDKLREMTASEIGKKNFQGTQIFLVLLKQIILAEHLCTKQKFSRIPVIKIGAYMLHCILAGNLILVRIILLCLHVATFCA